MQDKQDKKKKTNIKLNDLKPKKDAKGGVATNVSTNVSASRSAHSRQPNVKLVGQNKKAALLVRSLVRFFFVFFSTLNRRVSRTRRAAVPPGSPHSHVRDATIRADPSVLCYTRRTVLQKG